MAKRKATVAIEPAVIMNGIDVTIPVFLRQQRAPGEPKPDISKLLPSTQRTWVMPDPDKPREPKKPTQVFVHDETLPVQVNVRQKTGAPIGLATYDNMAEFTKVHDHSSYPVVRTASDKDQTIVLVSAKPWAKAHLPEATPKASPLLKRILNTFGSDVSPPTAKQERVAKPKAGEAWTDSILKACAQGAGRNAVIDFLCAAYPREDRKVFDNVMYGTLERLVAAGRLTKAKEGKGVVYRVVG